MRGWPPAAMASSPRTARITDAHLALAATADAKYRDPFAPMLEGVRHVPFNNLDAMDEAFDDSIGAVIVEPIQGEGGVRVRADGYLAGIRERCDARDILLICDEIQTGY